MIRLIVGFYVILFKGQCDVCVDVIWYDDAWGFDMVLFAGSVMSALIRYDMI